MEHTNGIITVANSIRSRRDVLKGAGAAMAALALTAANPFGAGRAFAASALQDLADVDIVNFALTLEHLEAEFYKQVVAGGQLSGQALDYLTTIRDNEIAHVDALTGVVSSLGGTPVEAQESYNFGDLSDQDAILAVANNLEEVGVGAYTGAARLIDDKETILAAAASIQQVEARHAAAIRFLRGRPIAPAPYGPVLTVEEVLEAVAPILGEGK